MIGKCILCLFLFFSEIFPEVSHQALFDSRNFRRLQKPHRKSRAEIFLCQLGDPTLSVLECARTNYEQKKVSDCETVLERSQHRGQWPSCVVRVFTQCWIIDGGELHTNNVGMR
jgi:hypothetical protein